MGDNTSSQTLGPGGPESDRGSDATTNLSVAAYTDPVFRDKLLNDICSRRDRALAPSPGVDISLIARHARRARSIDGVTMVLVVSYVVWRVIGATDQEWVNLLLTLGFWLIAAWMIQRVSARLNSPVQYEVGRTLNGKDMVLLGLLLLLIWSLLRIWRRYFGLHWTYEFPVFDVLVLGGIVAALALYRAIRVLRIQTKRRPWTLWSPRADDLDRIQRSEIVIHRDNAENRFTGFGKEEDFGREIHVPLVDTEGRPQPAPDIEGLFRAVKARFASLIDADAGPGATTCLEVIEQVHVPDRLVTKPVYWLKRWKVGGRVFKDFAEVRADPDWGQWAYLRLQMTDERGELVTNVLCRFLVSADSLYLEFRPHSLFRTDRRHDLFRGGTGKRVGLVASSVILGFLAAPLLIPQTPVSLRRTVWNGLKRIGRWAGRNLKIGYEDCGSPDGLRGFGSDPVPSMNQQFKTERNALSMIEHCLEAVKEYCGTTIDPTDLEQHIGKVAGEINVVNSYTVTSEAGGTINVAALGTGARGNVGAMGEESRGTIQGAPEAGRA
ncbi:hypothetical protein [Glycomyces rhizosphaerae]|uniref:Uncharacterized protein n=1 Tax=Glycomyces rhizosphaerae TaxID=2054422 RepID=A0ABV7PVZ9_9ACTN